MTIITKEVRAAEVPDSRARPTLSVGGVAGRSEEVACEST